MSWLEQLKFSIKIRRDLASKSATNNYHGLYLDANILDRLIAIVEGAEWGGRVDYVSLDGKQTYSHSEKACPICDGDGGHDCSDSSPCPYSDEWVKP